MLQRALRPERPRLGRPSLGVDKPTSVRLAEGQRERLLAAAEPGETLADTIRRIIDKGLAGT